MGELELGQIEEIVRICLLCDLSISRTHAVPGEGSPKARIFLIGEAPGREEDRLGRPFVGRAGQILDRLLLSIRLNRADAYITSVVKCRPPKNREPTMKEEVICNRYLARQLELIDPDVIVPMGRHAIACLFEMFGLERQEIAQVHGTTIPIEVRGKKKKIIPTYHPAVLTHNPRMRVAIEKDFRAVRSALKE